MPCNISCPEAFGARTGKLPPSLTPHSCLDVHTYPESFVQSHTDSFNKKQYSHLIHDPLGCTHPKVTEPLLPSRKSTLSTRPCPRNSHPGTISSYLIIPNWNLYNPRTIPSKVCAISSHLPKPSQTIQSPIKRDCTNPIQSNPIKTFSRLTVRGVRSSSRTRRSRWTERRRTRGAEGATMGTHPEHNMFHAYIATTSCGAWCNTLSKSSKAKMHIYRSTCNLITTKVTNMSQNMS